ncbi:SNARE associated Golgi protein [anaerobic digester metagenome]|nr:DedA family protein [Clostridiaceae bacterium HFYG-1003]
MEKFVQEIMQQYGYLGIFLLIFIENLFPPIPSEVILLFGGFMTVSAGLNVPLTIVAATAGSMVGAVVLYFLGYELGMHGIQRFFQGRIGDLLGLTPHDLVKTTEWFQKKGSAAIFLCRFIPLIRSLISIPAGITRMKVGPFLVLTLIGSTIWNTVLVLLGHFAGQGWNEYKEIFSAYSSIFVRVMAVAVALWLAWRIIRRFRRSRAEN